MAVYPPQSLSTAVQQQIVQYTQQLALTLNCVGMMNIQFVIHDEQVYVIEVNPRASRTVPFLSKVTGIAMAQVATRVILGESLASQGFETGLVQPGPLVHVKAPVFSFSKLNQVDSLLGPEMKSTGEVMGSDQTMAKALYKAFEAAKLHVPAHGHVLITVRDEDKPEALKLAQRFYNLGYQLLATSGTATYLADHDLAVQVVDKVATGEHDLLHQMEAGQIQVVINTVSDEDHAADDGALIRNTSIAHGVPLFTALDTVAAILQVLESQSFVTQAL